MHVVITADGKRTEDPVSPFAPLSPRPDITPTALAARTSEPTDRKLARRARLHGAVDHPFPVAPAALKVLLAKGYRGTAAIVPLGVDTAAFAPPGAPGRPSRGTPPHGTPPGPTLPDSEQATTPQRQSQPHPAGPEDRTAMTS